MGCADVHNLLKGRPSCRAGRHLSHLVPEIYSATAHLVGSASALAIPTGNSASEKATKRPKESRAYILARTASRGRRRIKRTIMNRSVQWTHLLFYIALAVGIDQFFDC